MIGQRIGGGTLYGLEAEGADPVELGFVEASGGNPVAMALVQGGAAATGMAAGLAQVLIAVAAYRRLASRGI